MRIKIIKNQKQDYEEYEAFANRQKGSKNQSKKKAGEGFFLYSGRLL